MGYNLKNAANGKSISKMPTTFEVIRLWKMMLQSKALHSRNFFHTNLVRFSKIQTFINSHSLMPCIPKVAANNLMKSRSCHGLAAKGLF